ncbi:hypothetical protein HDU93_005120 [Gonapodya sp. JEL0774]|nr:hypothetical protein HDU93_005120 [Gonapodya sp. JEL0774]
MKANATQYTVVSGETLEQRESRHLAPGDICMIHKGEKVPADLVLLSSAIDDGTCFIETSDLDGETNLKRRTALPPLAPLHDLEEVVQLRGVVRCSLPNAKIDEFQGTIEVSEQCDVVALGMQAVTREEEEEDNVETDGPVDGLGPVAVPTVNGMARARQLYPLSVAQFLPRGALLRNTEYIFGIVVYTGSDTKIMKNLRATSLKFSTLQGKLDWLMGGIFVYNMFLLIYSVVEQLLTQRSYVVPYQETGNAMNGPWYLWDPTNPTATGFLSTSNWATATWNAILTWFAIYTYVIPISLFVSLEITRIFQGTFMNVDLSMQGVRNANKSPSPAIGGTVDAEELKRKQSVRSAFRDRMRPSSSRLPSAALSTHTEASGDGNPNPETRKSISSDIRPRLSMSSVNRRSVYLQSNPTTPSNRLSWLRTPDSRFEQHSGDESDSASGMSPSARNPLPIDQRLGSLSALSITSSRVGSVAGSLVPTHKSNRSALRISMKLRGGQSAADQAPVLVPMKANNNNLTEDLGCVEYLFSDKTGTLTQNEMRMSKWWIAGRTLDQLKSPRVLRKLTTDHSLSMKAREDVSAYMRALILAHEVIPSEDDNTGELVYESQSPDETAILDGLRLNGLRLVGRTKTSLTISVTDSMGAEQEYELLLIMEFNSDRKRMSVVVRHPPSKGAPAGAKGPIFLYCKGADNVLLPRLSKDPVINDPTYVINAERALQSFGDEGLRTLVVASKPLSEIEWERLSATYETAALALEDREDVIEAVYEAAETDLKLLGLTAIEDRLQDEVPETISYLLKANVRIWVLTGDKQETAINIGMSSQLLSSDMKLHILNSRSEDEIRAQLEEAIQQLKDQKEWGEDHVKTGWRSPFSRGSAFDDPPELQEKWRKNGLVVTGDALTVLFASWSAHNTKNGSVRRANGSKGLDFESTLNKRSSRASSGSNHTSPRESIQARVSQWAKKNLSKGGGEKGGLKGELTDLQRLFLELGTRCNSVLCCRVTPLQKAQVVTLVRMHLKKVTLAIGDGANDVSMIQAAHVGVGISGREGAQAVRAADFAFLEFRFLRRLLAFHGRYDFMRMCNLIYLSFYKNIALVTMLWLFGFVSMWTGLSPYDEFFLLAYNVVLVSLSPIVLSVFENDIGEIKIEKFPEAYREVQGGVYWNMETALVYLVESLWAPVAIFIGVIQVFDEGGLTQSGRTLGFTNLIWFFSTTVFIAVTLKFSLVTRHWTIMHALAIGLSAVLFVIAVYLSAGLGYVDISSPGDLNTIPAFYFFILLVPVTVLLPSLAGMAVRDTIAPPDYVVLREEESVERRCKGWTDLNLSSSTEAQSQAI